MTDNTNTPDPAIRRGVSENGLALIKRFEGFSATPYLCPAGKWTIGYGHVISPHLLRGPVTIEEAEALLKNDLVAVESAINRLVTAPLTQNQFDALCSLIYNIGVGAFAASTLLKLLSSRAHAQHGTDTGSSDSKKLDTGLRRYDEAAKQFLRWVYAGGKRLPGLEVRRQAEMELFEKP